MSVHAPTSPSVLADLLGGRLHVVVDDAAYAATEAAKTLRLTGPVVDMQFAVPLHCMCGQWAAANGCWHALDLRTFLLHTVHQLDDADSWVAAHPGRSFPIEIRKSISAASRLVGPTPRLWQGMLPVGLRARSKGWGESK